MHINAEVVAKRVPSPEELAVACHILEPSSQLIWCLRFWTRLGLACVVCFQPWPSYLLSMGHSSRPLEAGLAGWPVEAILTSMHGILSITSYHFILLQPVPTVSRLPPVPRACMEISSETRFLVRYPGPPEIWLFRYQSGSCAPPHSKTQALVFRGQTNYWELRGNTIDDLEIISSATYTSPTISVFGKELLVKFFGKEPIRKQLAKQTFSQYFRKSCQEIMRTIYCWTSCRNWYHQNPSNLRDETRPSCLLRWPQQTVEACAWAAQCELLDSSKSIVGICASMNLHYTMSLSLVK